MNCQIWIVALCTAITTTGCNLDIQLKPLEQAVLVKPPATIAIQIVGYNPQPGKVFKDVFISNFSVKVSKGQLWPSQARDGLTDAIKAARATDYGFSMINPQSNAAGFGDLLIYLAGIDVSQQSNLFCGDHLRSSASNDAFIYPDQRQSGSPLKFLGLKDCEKLYLGLDPFKFDYDGDGIPDYLELRCGLNPKNANDANLSIAGDGVSNLNKCKQHIPIDESADSQPNLIYAYHYDIATQPDGSRMITTNNIAVNGDGQDDFIAIYITENDLSNKSTAIYTAYMTLPAESAGKTLRFNYWATDASKFHNQEIVAQ